MSTVRDEIIKKNIAFMYGRDPAVLAHDPDKRSFAKSIPKLVETDGIKEFVGEFSFLAPDFPCEVYLWTERVGAPSSAGTVSLHPEPFPSPYSTFEHALQASKLLTNEAKATLRAIAGVREVKKFVQRQPQREGWSDHCLAIAEKILRDKFTRNKTLRTQLLATKKRSLTFRNTYGDHFWGVGVDGKGSNHLGKLLDKIRTEAERGDIMDKWIADVFEAPAAGSVDIELKVSKDGVEDPEDSKTFGKHWQVVFGKSDECEIRMDHASVSRFHAMILADGRNKCAFLVDLGSSNGSILNGVRVSEAYVPVPIAADSELSFGASRKIYKANVVWQADAARRALLYSKVVNPLGNEGEAATGRGTDDDWNEFTVFAWSIPSAAKEKDILAFFQPCGKIKKHAIPMNPNTGEIKGFAIISFENAGAFMQAVSKDGDELLGENIRVKRNDSKKKKPSSSSGSAVVVSGGGGGGGGGGAGGAREDTSNRYGRMYIKSEPGSRRDSPVRLEQDRRRDRRRRSGSSDRDRSRRSPVRHGSKRSKSRSRSRDRNH